MCVPGKTIMNVNLIFGVSNLEIYMHKLFSALILFLSAANIMAGNLLDTDYGVDSARLVIEGGTRFTPGNGKNAPFLSTANEWDRYASGTNGLSGWAGLSKGLERKRVFDYAYGAEIDLQESSAGFKWFPSEAYVQGKLAVINIFAGLKKSIYGNQDAELSSGGLIWSKNARPVPRIAIESNDFVKVPFTYGLLELKGGISHGWFTDTCAVKRMLLHHKYLYGRIGGKLPVRITYGLQHVAQWGGEQTKNFVFGPVTWSNYKKIFFGEAGDETANKSDQINRLGNHILSKNLGVDVILPSVTFSAYWQNLYEEGPIGNMFTTPNHEDGLWGLSVKLNKFEALHSFVVEFLSTTDQSGPLHDLDGIIYGGADGFYRGEYPDGWTYYGMTLGNPWLTSPRYNCNGITTVANNAVRLWYFSGMGMLGKKGASWKTGFPETDYRLTLAYSKNYGLPTLVFPPSKNQFSGQLNISMILPWSGFKLDTGLSADRGSMYGNNFAAFLGLSMYM